MSDLKLYLLGAPYLEVDGLVVEIQRRKVLALLSYLTVTHQVHRRDALATLLWPDAGQGQARAALGRHLSELRKLIGKEHVQTDRETVGLSDAIWLDIGSFRQLVAAFDGQHPTSPDSLTEAVSLYRGDFMTGFTLSACPDFDEWQFFQSEGLRQEFASALTQLVAVLRNRGDYPVALMHARRHLALDALDEATQRQVMELYALTGQQAAALRQYKLCLEILADELGVPASAETTALVERIRTGEYGREIEEQGHKGVTVGTPIYPPHNLPAQIISFIGREIELAEVAHLLDEDTARLVTIVGPGGIGKTRLALAVAEAQLVSPRFPHGVFFVSLAPLSEDEHLVPAIAEAIGHVLDTEERVGQPAKTQLLTYLREKQLLLVLDNFEHLQKGVALVDNILKTAPQVCILATSRERLHLHGEQLYPVQGLKFPDSETPVDPTTFPALKLFIQTAKRIQPDYELIAADVAGLTRICRLVEGSPLGIELAAGWVDVLSLAEIAAEIQCSLDILETEARNIPDRQRSMRAVFDKSWERLGEPEQHAVGCLSVFRGGFTRQAAHVVAAASPRLLSRLVSQSLLQYDGTSGRYQIHELLRQYAAEKLELAGKTETVRDVYAAYFGAFLEQKEADLKGKAQRRARLEIAADFENVQRAWLWAVARRDYATLERAMEGLYWFLDQDLPRHAVGQTLFQRGREALAPGENEAPHAVWGKLLARVLRYGSGEFEASTAATAKPWLEQALSIAEAHANHAEQAFCHWLMSQVRLVNLGDFATAVAELEQALAYYRQVEDQFYIAWTLKILGQAHLRWGKGQQAIGHLQQSLGIFQALGLLELPVLSVLGLALAAQGEFKQGEAYLRRAYRLSQAEGNLSDMAGALVYLSRILSQKGDAEGAQTAALEALAIADENQLEYRQLQARMDVGLRAYERGDYEQAIAYLGQVQDHLTTDGNQRRVEVRLGLTVYHRGQADLAWRYLANRLQHPAKLALYSLPLAALLFHQAGLTERATVLLALFMAHNRAMPLHLDRKVSSELTSFQATLAAALTSEVFAAAWEQGRSLDLTMTLADLADELSPPAAPSPAPTSRLI